MAAKKKTYIYHNPVTGLIEHICEETGIIVLIQKSMRDDLLGNMKDTIPYKETNGVRTRIERGQGLEKMGLVVTKRWTYSETLAELICQRVSEGKTLNEICKSRKSTAGEPMMPPYFIVAKWRLDHPEFNEKLEQAFVDRSEIFHGKAIEQAELSDEDNSAAQKVIVDTMKWGASVDNPDRFGNKAKLTGEGDGPITFIINTGIDRAPLPAPKEKEAIVIKPKEIE